MRNLICCAVFFVIQTLQLTFASTLSNEEKLAARVDQIFEHFNASTPGAAVAVVKDGKLLLAKGYGMGVPKLGNSGMYSLTLSVNLSLPWLASR